MTTRGTSVAALLGAVALWSGSLSIVRVAVESASPGTLTFWRCLIGAVVLGGWVLARHLHAPARHVPRARAERASWWWAIASGVTCAAAFLLIAIGMEDVGSGPAGIVLSAIPGMTMLLAAAEGHGDPIGLRHVSSLAIGALGAGVLMLSTGGGWSVTGLVLLALAALAHAATNVASGRSLERLDPVVVAAVSMAVACVASLPFAEFDARLPLDAVLAIVALGILPTGIAYVMYFAGIRVLGTGTAAIANFLVPPVAVLAGVLLLGEVPDLATLTALVLAMTALWVGLGGVTKLRSRIETSAGRTV